MRRARSTGIGAAAPALALGIALVATGVTGPASARAQAPPPTLPAVSIRVVEAYRPDTGEREYTTVRNLNPGEIAAIQAALERARVPAAVTGRLDEPTADALRRFQRERDLEPCGCPSYETIVALGLPTRTVQILVRSDGRERGEAAGGDAVKIVYGTPPRRPSRDEASRDPSGETAPGVTEATARAMRRGVEPAPPAGILRHGHGLFFPILVTPGALFPPPPISPTPPVPVRRGLPFGRRPPDASRGGISTRAPPPSTRAPPPSTRAPPPSTRIPPAPIRPPPRR